MIKKEISSLDIQEKIKIFLANFETRFHFAGYAYIVLFSVMFSFVSLCVKLVKHIPVYQTIYHSSLFSLLLCFLAEPSAKTPKNPEVYKLLVKRGIIGATGLIFYYQSITCLPLSLAVLLLLINPLWLAIIGRFFYNEPFGFIHFSMTILCFSGLVLIIQPSFIFGKEEDSDSHIDRSRFIYGVICGISSSLFNATASLIIKDLRGRTSAVLVLFYYNFAAVLVGAIGTFYNSLVVIENIDYLCIFVVGLFFFLAQTSRNRALFLEPPFIVGIGSYSQLIFSYLFDFFIFGLTLNTLANIGCGIVIFGLVILMYKQKKK